MILRYRVGTNSRSRPNTNNTRMPLLVGYRLALSGWFVATLTAASVMPAALAEVPPPWTPVVVAVDGPQITAEVWGRKILWQQAPLPAQIETAGQELLAQPIRLVAAAEDAPLEWSGGACKLWEKTVEAASFIGWADSRDVLLNVYSRLEYDGFMLVELKLAPSRQPKGKLSRLWLEIPVRGSLARLFHYWPGRWGSAANSGQLPPEGLKLPFKAVLWIGWEEGGLALMAEEARHWQPADPASVLEVVPADDTMIIRVRLLDQPPAALPLTYRLMIQATPVKPWPEDFHSWHIAHGAYYGMEKSPAESTESPLDRAARLGVRTLVFHEQWTPIQNYWRTDEEDRLRELVAACHQRGIALWLYYGYEMSTLAPEFGEWAERALIRSPSGAFAGGYWRQPVQRDYMVCLASPWAERLLQGIIESIDRYGYDGVYLDGTIEPFGCANESHGCGYRTADGALRESYPIRKVRHFMEQLYRALVKRGKRINAHQSTYCGPATLSFVHSYWDGEQLQDTLRTATALETLPLGAFRAEFMGRNFGVPCEFLVYERSPQWNLEKALTITLLHDVRVRPLDVKSMLERMAPIWHVMEDFGVGKAEWHPYWRNQEFIHIAGRDALASGYRRLEGDRCRWLLVISNLSEKEPSTIEVTLRDPRINRLAGAKDALSGEALPVDERSFRVDIAPMRMRLVEVWSAED